MSECLHGLHRIMVRTVSLTCDGPSCYLAMLKALGANLNIDLMVRSFPHPEADSTVHVLSDT